MVLQQKIEKVQNRTARFATSNYCFETGSMTGIREKLRWESLKKRRRDRLILLYKVLPAVQKMTLSPQLGAVENITH